MPAVNQLKLSYAMYLLRRGISQEQAASAVELHPKYLNQLVRIVNRNAGSDKSRYRPVIINNLWDIIDIGILDVMYRCQDARVTTSFLELCDRQSKGLQSNKVSQFTPNEWGLITAFWRLAQAIGWFGNNPLDESKIRKVMLMIALSEYIRAYDHLIPRPLVRQIHKGTGRIVITDNGKPHWFQHLPENAGCKPLKYRRNTFLW